MPPRIEPMALEHVDAVWQLEQACFSVPWSHEALRAEVGNAQAAYFVALADSGALAGYAGLRFAAGEGDITNVAVAERFRRQGVGGALLTRLLVAALALDLQRLHLEVRVSNAAAIALYERFGFARVGLRRGYYRRPTEDAVLMTRSLTA